MKNKISEKIINDMVCLPGKPNEHYRVRAVWLPDGHVIPQVLLYRCDKFGNLTPNSPTTITTVNALIIH